MVGVPISLQVPSLPQLQQRDVARGLKTFVHFGPQTFNNTENPVTPPSTSIFAPTSCDPTQWVAQAKIAKAKASILTVSHSTGFRLYDSPTSSYTIKNSPFWATSGGMNIAPVWAASCRDNNIAPIFYVCAKNLDFEANNPEFTQAAYKSYLQTLIAELVAFGCVGIWLDADNAAFFGSQGYPWASCIEACNYVRSLDPSLICINNSRTKTLADTNIAVYEGANFPGEFVGSGNTIPSECCETAYDDGGIASWFWKSTVPTLRSVPTLIANIALCAARMSSYTINWPPDNTGLIESRMQTGIAAVGAR